MVPHRRNVATADELARIEQFNSAYQDGIVPMRAGFTKNEKKGSYRPFSIFLSKDYPSGTSVIPYIMRNPYIMSNVNKRWNPVPVRHFSSMEDIEKYADRKIKKEQYILDEVQKMQTLLKMYDLSDKIFIYRTENRASVVKIRVAPIRAWEDDNFIRCDTVEKMVWRCHDLIRVHG